MPRRRELANQEGRDSFGMRRRAGTHIRQNRVTGQANRLNDKAIKVLSAIKFSPTGVTREDISDKTSLPAEDIERQVRLLLSLNMIKADTRFPRFPQQGWRVYTELLKHDEIIRVLRSHGVTDKPSSITKTLLDQQFGDYYPKGMDLEGRGRQSSRFSAYPETEMGGESHYLINEDLSYRTETINIMMQWRDEIRPFRPKEYSEEAIRTKLKKFKWLSDKLADVYGIEKPNVIVGDITMDTWSRAGSSGSSNYQPAINTITIHGKFSVITFLHEFGHARGFGEVDTVLWSLNLFKRIFPISFAKLQPDAHTAVQRDMTFNLGG